MSKNCKIHFVYNKSKYLELKPPLQEKCNIIIFLNMAPVYTYVQFSLVISHAFLIFPKNFVAIELYSKPQSMYKFYPFKQKLHFNMCNMRTAAYLQWFISHFVILYSSCDDEVLKNVTYLKHLLFECQIQFNNVYMLYNACVKYQDIIIIPISFFE